ncbi:SMC family ATPase [Algoriphagus kandeliae]|uniref:SMC family ATPase n=1 Tax=Algoriphagus kandeliae TaxID=2562278 RepID=A0A4Y9QUI6_9BACT|nr:SMC family ATPase [Algoriphagus kandeliae]TFV96261.1 SMC family ATPase [Algoriphagus kandeliae]
MIPVQLEIQGLYSYRERQVIDFSQLTAAGLFGIFGAVGSGKSSILEAILLALYGSTERLSDRGEKNSMLNLQSDEVLIRFIFNSGKNNSETFLARYEAKRNKKDPEKVDPATHTFYKKSGNDWEPLEARAEEIVGMKKEHFKQTVIIPQGKFREFIDLTPGPRAEMMKELFGLERFDLAAKTGFLLRTVKDEKIRLETQLQALEAYSEETLKTEKEKLNQLQAEQDQELKKANKLDQEVKSLEKLRDKHRTWKELSITKRELLERKPEIEEKRRIYKDFIQAKTYLRPVWNQLSELQVDAEKYRVSITDSERFALAFEQEISQLKEEEQKLREKNQQRPDRESKIRDLKKVLEIKELRDKMIEASDAIAQITPSQEKLLNKQKQIQQEIEEFSKSLETSPSNDSNLLASLKSQLQSWSDWESQIQEHDRLIGQFEKEEKNVSAFLEKLHYSIPEEFGNTEDWQKAQKQVILNWDERREHLLRNSGLKVHAHLLEDGKPCPLCGSVEHPNPLDQSAQNQAIKEIELQISQEKDLLEKILLIRQQLKEQEIYLQSHRDNLERRRKEKGQLTEKLSKLLESLKEFDLKDQEGLSSRIAELENSNQKREDLLQKIQRKRQESDQVRAELDTIQQKLQQAQLKKESLATAIKTKEEEIKDPTFCKGFFDKNPTVIQDMILRVAHDIEQAAAALESKQKYLQEVQNKATTNLADLKNFKNSLEKAQTKIKELQSEFESLKKEYGFEDEEALIRLFEHSLDAEKTAKEIEQFDRQLDLTENRLQELESEKGVKDFEEELFQELSQQLENLQQSNNARQEEVILLQKEVKVSEQKLQEKAMLKKELERVEKRETYLKELEKLFKGSGFVKYVSSIYLKELCHTANQRFMKLSKNSLSLEIDEDNTFWVIDYLNGGKRRLLKTLSGGQTFQASLCLALALAEKVKALNQADQSFFFLDEGFGALDRNSLRVVFETLKSLRHENRIVGIISHVEELQQEIGVFAQVELDPEKGSQVGYSY